MTDRPEDLLFSNPEFFADPYPVYAAMREQCPVYQHPLGLWMVFRFTDCRRLLTDPNTSVDLSRANLDPGSSLHDALSRSPDGDQTRSNRFLVNVDPPDHTRLRRLVSQVFSPSQVESLRPMVQNQVDGLLGQLADQPEFDAVTQFAFPFPFQVISTMLGMPETDSQKMRDWSYRGTLLLEPLLNLRQKVRGTKAMKNMYDHCLAAIEWKRQNPADDLLTALIAAESDGDRLTTEELADMVVFVFMAGHETTINLITLSLLHLTGDPERREQIVTGQASDASVVDEMLRFDSPVQFTRRVTTQDFVADDGTCIPAGSLVMVCVGSANRDHTRWGHDADVINFGRQGNNKHLSFGAGIHHCLGAALARLEGQEAIPRFFRRFPDVSVPVPPTSWRERMILRSVDSLPMTLPSSQKDAS